MIDLNFTNNDIPQIGDKVFYWISDGSKQKTRRATIIKIIDKENFVVQATKFIEPIKIRKCADNWTTDSILPLSILKTTT
jgi:hypothetical protein